MKKFLNKVYLWLAPIRRFFFPPPGSTRMQRALPFGVLSLFILLAIVGITAGWEYTNTTDFCGKTCHTMPPEYITHANSNHARVTCEDCHLGRGSLAVLIPRKIDYSKDTGLGMIFSSYEYPLRAKKMRPANDSCETCHYPQVFTNDKVVELKSYGNDLKNTLSTTYLIMKTGGGSQRKGLGFGIHWHVENPVYFYATDPIKQDIPYIRYKKSDGTTVEFFDTEAKFDKSSIREDKLETIDCISCHNRTAHGILSPEKAVDNMIGRGLISVAIPEIRRVSVDMLNKKYVSSSQAKEALKGIDAYYKQNYSDFYSKNQKDISKAIDNLSVYYDDSFFLEQKVNPTSHPDNIQHKDVAGCFRCHDGKHLSAKGEAIRLECNLCHSLPVIATGNNLVTNLPVDRGIEPPSHKDTNWITLHRDVFDPTCVNCHTIADAGGSSDKSFCSNSACHGTTWKFAGFDAPKLRESLKGQAQKYIVTPTPKPSPTPTPPPAPAGSTPAPTKQPDKVTYESITTILQKCTACHGEGGAKGVNLSTYKSIMADGKLVVANDPKKSVLITVQDGSKPHFVQWTEDELKQVTNWISAGAPEK